MSGNPSGDLPAGTPRSPGRVHVVGAGPVGLFLTALLQSVEGLLAYCAAVCLLLLAVLGMAVYTSFIKFWPYDKSMSLRHYTPYSQGPGIYMVTGAKVVKRKVWIRIQLPKRPNGTQGWVPEAAVDVRRNVTWIRVKTGSRTVQVFRKGVPIKTFRAAVGTGGTPTPKGLFAIWDPVPTGGQLGPYILVLTAHSNVLRTFAGGDGIVGIHGWPSSGVLGQAVSHGCVRMARDGVRALSRYATPGVPVEIVA